MFGHQNHDNGDVNAPLTDNLAADQPVTDNSWQHPGTPLSDNNLPVPSAPPADDVGVRDESTAPPIDEHTAQPEPEKHVYGPDASDIHGADKLSDDSLAPDEPISNDLIDIKQQALSKLSPLVGHLEQTPEEKFKTTMMMIQASDNQTLIPQAYEAAQQIDDEKTRAQALLDVINEINYFTQPKDKPE
jgi:hypothetical protein